MTEKKNNANHEIMQADSMYTLSEGVSTFTFDSTDGVAMPVRVLTDGDGEPWFVAKDVCDILGISTNHLREKGRGLDDDEVTEASNLPNWEIGGISTCRAEDSPASKRSVGGR